jgi:hypothetical protein
MRPKRRGERHVQLTMVDGIAIATACWEATSGHSPSVTRFLRTQQEMQQRCKEQMERGQKQAQQRQAREERLANRDHARGVQKIEQRAAQRRAKKTTQRLQEAQEKTNTAKRHLQEAEQRCHEMEAENEQLRRELGRMRDK